MIGHAADLEKGSNAFIYLSLFAPTATDFHFFHF
jgi:hypothetical protein